MDSMLAIFPLCETAPSALLTLFMFAFIDLNLHVVSISLSGNMSTLRAPVCVFATGRV